MSTHRRQRFVHAETIRQASRGDGGERTGLTEAEMRTLLSERYLEWNDDRRGSVITTITSQKEEGSDD